MLESIGDGLTRGRVVGEIEPNNKGNSAQDMTGRREFGVTAGTMGMRSKEEVQT